MRTNTGILTYTDLSRARKVRQGSGLIPFLEEMDVIRSEEMLRELTGYFEGGSGSLSRFFMDYRYRDFALTGGMRRMMPVYGVRGATAGITRQASFVELLLGKESDLVGNGFNENIFGIDYLNGEDTVTLSDQVLQQEIGKSGIVRPVRISPVHVEKLCRTLVRLWDAHEKDPRTRFVIVTGRAYERSVEILRELFLLLPDRLRMMLGFQTNAKAEDLDVIQASGLPICVLTAEPGFDTSRRWAFPVILCEWDRMASFPCSEERLALVRKLAESMSEKMLIEMSHVERNVLFQREAEASSFKYYGTILRKLFPEVLADRRKGTSPAAGAMKQSRQPTGTMSGTTRQPQQPTRTTPGTAKQLERPVEATPETANQAQRPARATPETVRESQQPDRTTFGTKKQAQPSVGATPGFLTRFKKPSETAPERMKQSRDSIKITSERTKQPQEPPETTPERTRQSKQATGAAPQSRRVDAAPSTEQKLNRTANPYADYKTLSDASRTDHASTEQTPDRTANPYADYKTLTDASRSNHASPSADPHVGHEDTSAASNFSQSSAPSNSPASKGSTERRKAFAVGAVIHESETIVRLRHEKKDLVVVNKKLEKENHEMANQVRDMSTEVQKLRANLHAMENDKDSLGRSRHAAEREIKELTDQCRRLKGQNDQLTKANIVQAEKLRKARKGKAVEENDGAGSEPSPKTKPTYENLERRIRQLYRKNKALRKRCRRLTVIAVILFLLMLLGWILFLLGRGQKTGATGAASATTQRDEGVTTQTGEIEAGTAAAAQTGQADVAEAGTSDTTSTEEGQAATEEVPSSEGAAANTGTGATETNTGTGQTAGRKDDWAAIQGTNPKAGITWAETTDRLGQPTGFITYYHIRFAQDESGRGLSEDGTLPYIGVYVNNKPNDTDEVKYYQWKAVSSLDPSNGIRADWIDVPGIDYYLHIAYASMGDGSDFSTTDPTGRNWVGWYISGHAGGGVSPDSTNVSDYKWVSR